MGYFSNWVNGIKIMIATAIAGLVFGIIYVAGTFALTLISLEKAAIFFLVGYVFLAILIYVPLVGFFNKLFWGFGKK